MPSEDDYQLTGSPEGVRVFGAIGCGLLFFAAGAALIVGLCAAGLALR